MELALDALALSLRARRSSATTLDEAQAIALDKLSELVRLVGAPLLRASDPEELAALIDHAIDLYDGEQGRAVRAAVREHATALGSIAAMPVDADYSALLPRNVARRMAQADHTMRYVDRLKDQWLSTMQLAGGTTPVLSEPRSVVDPDLPVELLRSMYTTTAGLLAGLALLHIISEGLQFDEWILAALAEQRFVGARELLRYVASLPGIEVPENVVAHEERFDWTTLRQTAQTREQWIQRMLDEAAASDRPVYPPFEQHERWPEGDR